METSHTYTLPATFVLDAFSRGLNVGTLISSNKKQARIESTEEQINELFSDAAYYSSESKYLGSDFKSICQSAAATMASILKQMKNQ
jgi:hypothetical protein